MGQAQAVFDRTVAEAIRRAKLLFQAQSGHASTSGPGLVPPTPGDATQFLNGAATPAYAAVKDSDLATTDVTSNNVTIAKHGFAPKLPNDATKYLDGTGAYTVPGGGGGGGLPTFPTITNLELRLSAELSTMTVNADGRVAQINDLSGGWGSNFTAAGGARPRLVGNGMARLRPGLVFDGANAKLTAGGTKTIAQPCTVVGVVMNWKGGANNNNMLRDSGGGPVLFHSAGNSWAMFAGTALTDTNLFAQNTAMLIDGDIGAPAVCIGVFNGASSTLYNNGVASSTAAAGASGFSGTLSVGGDSTTSFAHMVLYELLIFSKALNGTELGQINTYYATALGLHL